MLDKRHTDHKVSKILLDVAGDYIATGENLEERQRYLNSAVSSWNIACLALASREKALKQYRKSYRRLNSSHMSRDWGNLEHNLRVLIKKKTPCIRKCEFRLQERR